MALAHERFEVPAFPTPLPIDLIFYEVRDSVIPENEHGNWEYGQPHENSARYPNHELVYVSARREDGKQQWYFAAERENQDAYNFSFTKADIGGTRFDSVTRTYITKRSAFTPNTPAMGAAMPNVPVDLFSGAYVLAEKQQTRIREAELDSLYVTEARVYVKRCTITQLGVDSQLNGEMLTSTDYLWHKDELPTGGGGLTTTALFAAPSNSFWGLQSDGTKREGQQLSCEWFSISTEVVVGGTFTAGVVDVDSYYTNVDYYWPPVLGSIIYNSWPRISGQLDIYPAVKFDKEGYSGPCRCLVSRTWSPTPFTIAQVEQMLPERMSVSTPYYALNVPETLHPAWIFTSSSGTEDPVYEYVTFSDSFPATSPTDWPATITAYDSQDPFRGGYLRTTRVVSQPS